MVPGKRLIKLVFGKRGFLISFDIPCQPAKRFKNSSKHYTGRNLEENGNFHTSAR